MKDPNELDHVIIFKDEYLRIPLQLNGTFSYFHTWALTHKRDIPLQSDISTPRQ